MFVYKLILQLFSLYFFFSFLFADSKPGIARLKLARAWNQSEIAKKEICRMEQKDKTLEVTTALDSEMYRHLMNIVSFLSKRKSVNVLIGRGAKIKMTAALPWSR